MLDFLARNRVATLLVVLVLTYVAIGAAAPGYLSGATASVVVSNSLVLMLISLGTMIVILTRNIDVSSGSVLGLSAAVLGLSLDAGVSLPLAIAFCLLTGAAAGAFNGLMVAYLGIPSIVATLGTLGLYRGIMLVLTGGRWIEDLPQNLKALAGNLGFGFSALTVVVLVLMVLVWLGLRKTHFGRYFYAVGDNREAAHHLGVPVKRVQFTAFIVTGICAALAGLVFAAQIGFIPNQAGNGIELKAIAVNVLGGVSLLGGTGSVAGVAAAVIFITSIDSALVFLKIPAYWNDFIAGAILLSVLLLDGRIRQIVDRRIRARRYAVHERSPAPSAETTKTQAVEAGR
ncbi:autoinducer 2 ABC transporter permease LsrC [Nitratireductor indicus]|uniref:Autoinducer 2 import system permease protein LsrC n=1 Tax=Nitratireductor indicus C115 TaxID=1231190 RepID=K2NZA9_9HYPH|nr:autoinducer 2 ABC transporter permease LsrC [Nitratireductor indicus]EKF43244.1 sugar ABC transporter permease [Nitratireductor indicus C115]MDS1137797.1 autoinducer 2 ABC transporter permease LsrC [Nitratireductor indicus]SFQ54038.1 AI-2 transport system permease protein [Nitratireductor indicus]